MSTNATSLSTPASDTGSEGRQSPSISGAEELVRDSLAATGLINVPPRVISVSDTGSTATSLPLGELPVLPLVVNPLRRPLSLQNVRALRSNRTSSPPNLCIEPSMLHAPGSPTTAISRPISPIELEPPPLSPPDPSLRPPTPPTPARSWSPTLNQSQSHHLLRGSTVWEHYLRTQGGRIRDPLYDATTPTKRRVRKPRKYNARPEELREEEILALSQIPTGGRMLTRSYLGKIKRTPLPPYPVSD
jgi:hypothetical protein